MKRRTCFRFAVVAAAWLAAAIAAQARFLQADPVGYQDDLDLYMYVHNDPTDKTDPTGKDPLQDQVLQEVEDRQAFQDCGNNGACLRAHEQRFANQQAREGLLQAKVMAIMATPALGAAGIEAIMARVSFSAAFEEAAIGGRNAGLITNNLGRSVSQLERGVESMERNIAEHEAKLADPAKYAEDWASRSDEAKQGLLKYWQKEIQNYKDQRDILKDLKDLKKMQMCTGSRIPGNCP